MVSDELLITLCAGAVLLFFIARGYKRGILVELGRLISLALTLAALFFCKPYSTPLIMNYLPVKSAGLATVYILLTFIVYKIVYQIVLKIGIAVREVPVVGWVAGMLGAAAGCVETVIMVGIFQLITGIPVTASVSAVLEKGGVW